MSLNVLGLFAGIGGIGLGLERSGMTVVGQVEIDPYCQRVLEKHWPEVPKHDDVRTASGWWAKACCENNCNRPRVDLICGGFPCRPFSQASPNREGIADERWGWPWMRDVVADVRPRYVVAENVAALVRDTEAFRIILGGLSDIGFHVEWEVLSACRFGAPQARERVFLVAYPAGADVAGEGPFSSAAGGSRSEPRGTGRAERTGSGQWLSEPAVDRVAHGLPIGLVREEPHALGNSVVPSGSEYVGRLIVSHESQVAA